MNNIHTTGSDSYTRWPHRELLGLFLGVSQITSKLDVGAVQVEVS